VGFREIFEEQPEFAQAVDVHEVGVINDGDEQATFAMRFPCGFDELLFAAGIAAFGLDPEGLAEDPKGIGVGVQCPGYGRGDDAFGIMLYQGVFDDAFAGSGFAHNDAQAALAGVHEQRVEDFLLVVEKAGFAVIEGVGFESEV
jgi:hypothetical protein